MDRTKFQWLEAEVGRADGPCLVWPFIRMPTGYGVLSYRGRQHYAHRLMCTLVNGKPPTKRHHAAHECGRGTSGCVHPRHLKWKTPLQNKKDRKRHGYNGRSKDRKLSLEQVKRIIALKGTKTQAELAVEFGVCHGTIGAIHRGKLWAAALKGQGRSRDKTDILLAYARGDALADISRAHGVSESAISHLAERNGLPRRVVNRKAIP
jgi:hypothetical protein